MPPLIGIGLSLVFCRGMISTEGEHLGRGEGGAHNSL